MLLNVVKMTGIIMPCILNCDVLGFPFRQKETPRNNVDLVSRWQPNYK